MARSVLRPGLMVSLRTSLKGGVTYKREDLEAPDGAAPTEAAEVQAWKTIKVTEDPASYKAAREVQSKAAALVRKHCVPTEFCLFCPLDREAELDLGVTEARKLVADHNAADPRSRVSLYVVKGTISTNDEDAARAVTDEVRRLLAEMNRAIDALEPEAIREAADRAAQISRALEAEESAKLGAAATAARKAARDIVRRVEKGGEMGAVVLADVQRGAIEQARFAFLDLEAVVEAAGESIGTVDARRSAGLEIEATAEEEARAVEAAIEATSPLTKILVPKEEALQAAAGGLLRLGPMPIDVPRARAPEPLTTEERAAAIVNGAGFGGHAAEDDLGTPGPGVSTAKGRKPKAAAARPTGRKGGKSRGSKAEASSVRGAA